VSYIVQVIKTTIFLENESFFLQQVYSTLKYTMNCLGSGVVPKLHLYGEETEKKEKEKKSVPSPST
jgi:hypothetical protein